MLYGQLFVSKKEMRYVLVNLLLFLSCLSEAQPHDFTLALDSIFNDWTSSTPGGVVAVVHHDKVIYRKAFGLADMEKKIPNAPEWRYDLASIAKQFTAMCIALLEEQSKLSANDDLKKFYPEMKITDEIRIKNLIDHTSGLRDASVLAILSGKMNLKGGVRKKFNTKDYYIECFLRETNLNFEPGSETAYTNFNYVLLADIVEKVSGQSFTQFMDSAIFKPLGMDNTVLRNKVNMDIPMEAKGYRVKGEKYKPVKAYGGVLGDHNMLSTLDDMIRWELNFFDNQLGKGDPALISKVFTSSTLNNGDPSGYGYGLWISDYRSLPQISHGGDDGRHTSHIIKFPEEELIIIVLANSSQYRQTEGKTYKIADFLLRNKLKDPKSEEDSFTFITLPDSVLQSKSGLYTRIDERGLGQLIKMTHTDGALFGNRSWYGKGTRFFSISPNYFVAKGNDGKTIGIRFGLESGVQYVDEFYGENQLARYYFHKNEGTTYRHFAGTFLNQSTGARLKIKSKKDKIVAHKGIIKIPLISFGTDQFYAPNNIALFIFQRDENKRVHRLKVNAPDFRNFIFEREK